MHMLFILNQINVKLTQSAIDSQEDPLPQEKSSFQYFVFLIAFQNSS